LFNAQNSDLRQLSAWRGWAWGDSELRNAFKAVMNDPELRPEAVKLCSEEPDPTGGEEAQKIVADMYATPEASVAKLRRILSK
jgi:hypothetical protein